MPLLVLAILVKETTFFLAAPLALAALRQRQPRRAALIALPPLVAAVAWRAWLLVRLGGGPGGSGRENFDWPLVWVPAKLARPLDLGEAAALAALLLAIVAAVALLPSLRRWEAPEICFAASVLVALFLSRHVYLPNWFNHGRVLLAVPALAIVVGERQQSAWRRSLLRLLPLLWTVPAVALVWGWTVAYGAAVAIVWWLFRGAPTGPATASSGDVSRSAAPP